MAATPPGARLAATVPEVGSCGWVVSLTGWTPRRSSRCGRRCRAAGSSGDAAVRVGTYRKQGTRWVAACGGVRPRRGRDLKGRCLTFAEREEIALARAGGESIRGIARRLGWAPSTVSRELPATPIGAAVATGRRPPTRSLMTASRPKPAKLAVNVALRELMQDDLLRRYSPEQIAGRLRRQFPGQPEMCRPRRSTSRSTCSPEARSGAS
jgi:hypothetical protein